MHATIAEFIPLCTTPFCGGKKEKRAKSSIFVLCSFSKIIPDKYTGPKPFTYPFAKLHNFHLSNKISLNNIIKINGAIRILSM